MPTFFRHESSDLKYNAQRNLYGRTHYVDDDTLRYFKARVLSSSEHKGGLLFCLVESVALDPHNRARGYRGVVFDVFGTVLSRSDLENCKKSRAAAAKEIAAFIAGFDAVAHTLAAIEREKISHAREMEDLAAKVRAIKEVQL